MEKTLFNLQLFAEETAAGANDATEQAASEDKANSNNQQQTEKKSENQPQQAKYTDKDVDEIINKKFAEWQKKQEKAVDEAKKLADMNATQKAEYQRDQLQKELDELKKANSIAEMSKTARKILADDHNINISDDLLSHLVTVDAEETKAAVESFAKLFKGEVENAVKERIKGEPPRKGTGGTATMTKEQIMNIKDPEARQKAMLENKHLFNF